MHSLGCLLITCVVGVMDVKIDSILIQVMIIQCFRTLSITL